MDTAKDTAELKRTDENLEGNRSSRPKVISPEVISPGTRVMSPEIHSHVARNFTECINLKKSNILSKSQGINS